MGIFFAILPIKHIKCHSAYLQYNVVILSVAMLSVNILSVAMLNVMLRSFKILSVVIILSIAKLNFVMMSAI
jgi:hypothetical protein